MDPEQQDLLRQLAELNERIGPYLASLNAAPATLPQPAAAVGVTAGQSMADALGSRMLSFDKQMEMRKDLRQRTSAELHMLFAKQALREDTGIPLGIWLAAGGQARADLFAQRFGDNVDASVMKALDTTGAAPLIRQDLEPILYELFVREFPAWERFTKEPANGLTHTYQQDTSFGDAQFMPELGTVTDDRSAYERATTNVSIIATRRGVSIKSQLATLQSGSGFNPEQLELTGGLRAIAHRLQVQIFSGHGTDSGGTANNELGAYDANGFTGLRSILNSARVKNVDPWANGASPAAMRRAWNRACVEIMNISPGRPKIIYMNPLDKEAFDNSQDQNIRYVTNLKSVGVGVETNAVNTVFGDLPLYPVPGDSISSYTSTEYDPTNDLVRDSYILDEATITMPYLGSEGLTVLQIPVGVSGQLNSLFIIFGMYGLAVKAPTFSNKVRIGVGDDE